MFQQYNMLQKMLRIIIFAALASLIMIFVPDASLNQEDLIKIVSALLLVFIIYDFYYPAVRIEFDREKMQQE
jgi:hypothetical protein